jgi:hypothetical protein
MPILGKEGKMQELSAFAPSAVVDIAEPDNPVEGGTTTGSVGGSGLGSPWWWSVVVSGEGIGVLIAAAWRW